MCWKGMTEVSIQSTFKKNEYYTWDEGRERVKDGLIHIQERIEISENDYKPILDGFFEVKTTTSKG
jgi:hypothetical protein